MYLLRNSNILWGVLVKRILAAIGFVLILSALVLGFDFQASQDSVSIQCTTGKAFFFVKNTENQKLQVAFSANTGQLTGYFDTPSATLQPFQSASTTLYFNAPDDLKGTQDVYVTAQACNASSCSSQQLRQRVFLNPCKTPTRFAQAPNDNLVLQKPSLYFAEYDYPTEYSVLLRLPKACQKAVVGQHSRIKASLQNTGAAATYDLEVAGEVGVTNAELSRNYLSLARSEAKDFYLDVTPEKSGVYYVAIRAKQNQGAVDEQDLCLDVQDFFEAVLTTPTSLSVKSCETVQLNASLKNTGTTTDTYYLQTNKGEVDREQVELDAGKETIVSVWLQPSDGEVQVRAVSKSGLEGKAVTKLEVTPCNVPVTVVQPAEPTTLSITVQNTLDTPLENVTIELVGIPAAWKYEAENATTIPARSNKTLSLKLTQTSAEEAASPALIVKSNGKPVATKQLQAIRPTTGLFAANLTQNAVVLGILFVAIAVFLYFTSKTKTHEENLKQRLAKIREQVKDKQ